MFDVFLMQGPSGSGKSKYASMMKDAAMDAGYITSILSADDYFRDDSGNYNFNPKLLNRAHMSVVTRAFRLMNHATDDKNGSYRIIIDNTHMETWEWEAISVIAHELGARRIVLQGADILYPFDEFDAQDHDSLDTMARVLHHRQDKGMDYTIILRQLLKYQQTGGEIPSYVEVRTFNTGLK
jgi:hypothetical protein